jgi:hypothetical protein
MVYYNHRTSFGFKLLFVLIIFGLGGTILYLSSTKKCRETTISKVVLDPNPSPVMINSIDSLITSFDIPLVPMKRLPVYLQLKHFQGKGLYSIKLSDHVLLEHGFYGIGGPETINLDDPYQNTLLACYLISDAHKHGYTWDQAFVVYVFGYSSLDKDVYYSAKVADFLSFINEVK